MFDIDQIAVTKALIAHDNKQSYAALQSRNATVKAMRDMLLEHDPDRVVWMLSMLLAELSVHPAELFVCEENSAQSEAGLDPNYTSYILEGVNACARQFNMSSNMVKKLTVELLRIT